MAQYIFYVVDDEKVMTHSLKSIISKAFPTASINLFEDGASAWKSLEHENQPLIIVSDMNMPGITGLQLMKKVKTHETLKESFFMLMSANHNRDENLTFLREGADEYLSKPFEIDEIIAKLRNAVRIIDSKFEIEKLQNDIKFIQNELKLEGLKQKDLIVKFIELRIPEYASENANIKESAVWIAKQLSKNKDEIETIENVAELAHAARILLPEKSLTKPIMISGRVQNDDMQKIPEYFDTLTKNIRNFEKESEILRHIYENYDGTGIPKQIQSWKVPLGSRILRVALDFEELRKKNKDNAAKAIEGLFHEGKRLYDFKVVAYYDQFLATKNSGSSAGFSGVEVPHEIKELESGMTVSRNIITESGMILIASSTQLNDEKIERVKTIVKSDPIIGRIYIKQK